MQSKSNQNEITSDFFALVSRLCYLQKWKAQIIGWTTQISVLLRKMQSPRLYAKTPLEDTGLEIFLVWLNIGIE